MAASLGLALVTATVITFARAATKPKGAIAARVSSVGVTSKQQHPFKHQAEYSRDFLKMQNIPNELAHGILAYPNTIQNYRGIFYSFALPFYTNLLF